MTTIALHKYTQKIEQLIEEQQIDEAISHCRHILQQHPRHVDTYRTLAKAYLERGDYSDAVDLIHRVLSTDPSDMIAHVALSVAFKEQSKLDQSIWHLERALDVEPYNTPLREELVDLYTLKKADLPDSMAPSSAALARLYLKSEMYQAAIVELRHALAQEPNRIDLKVMLAETLYLANQRIETVSLSLEILDVLPNCIPVNAILAEIWLQTGRVAEAQTYLQRLQAMTLLDKAHFDPETTVGRAFIARGAPAIPDEVTVEQFGEEPLLEPDSEPPVIAMIDSDWIEEFSMEDTAELPEAEAAEVQEDEDEDEGVTGWLVEAALATGENFGTQPLVMPPDPLEAESDWFIDSGDGDDESLDDLLGDVGGDTQLDDWLDGLDAKVSDPLTDEPEDEGPPGFTGMLTGLLDSELEMVDDTAVSSEYTDLLGDTFEPQAEEMDDTAVSSEYTDLFGDTFEPQVEEMDGTAVSSDVTDQFAGMTEPHAEDAPALNLDELGGLDLDQFLADQDDKSLSEEQAVGSAGGSFAEGLTALFSEMDSSDSEIADSFDEADDEADEIDLDAFLESDLETLAEADESDEADEHTGYTQLFDQLSTDAFPEELEEPGLLDSDWLSPTTDALAPDLDEGMDDEEAPDWLAEVKQDEFEPVQIDPKLAEDWLSAPDTPTETADEAGQSDWLTALAGDEPEMAAPDESDWLAELAGDDSSEDSLIGDEPEMAAPDEDDWLAELAGDSSSGDVSSEDESATAVPDSQLPTSDDLSDIPTWMLGGEKEAPAVESPAPIDFAESVGFDTDELEADTAVPTWLLGGDKISEETGALDESAPLHDILPPDSTQIRENPQTILAGEKLPDWLREPESDEPDEPPTTDPLQTDSMMDMVNEELPDWLTGELPELDEPEKPETQTEDPLSTPSMVDLVNEDLPSWFTDDEPEIEARPIPEPDSDFDLYKDDINIPDWLMDDFSTGQDQAEVSVTGDKNEREPVSPQEPEELSDSLSETSDDDLGWLEELAASADEPAELMLDDEAESASYASRVAAGEGGAVDELPTQVSMPDELPDFGGEPDGLDLLEGLGESEPDLVDENFALDWTRTESEMEDVLAGVTGELNADLDWLDSLAEESATAVELVDKEIDEFDSGTGWLDDLTIAGDTGPLAEFGAEPILPDFADSLSVLPDEPEESMDWLSELEESTGSTGELAVEPVEFEETAVPETDDALTWLGELAAEPDDSLDDLLGLASESSIEEAYPELESDSAQAALDWLEAVSDEADELEIIEEPEASFSEVTDLEDSIPSEPPEDIDDAMAWLEALAAGQGARMEELPSMVDGLATEPEIVMPQEPTDEIDAAEFTIEAGLETDISAIVGPEFEIEDEDTAPEDIDDAMAWLEGLAAKQGARLEELPSMAEAEISLPDSIDETEAAAAAPDTSLEWLEDLAEDVVEDMDAPYDLGLESELESVDASLDWLEEMPETEEAVAELPEQESEEAVEEASAVEVPDNLDDAMVWLDALAEEQDESVEALSDVTDEIVVDETAVPDASELDTELSFDDTPADLDDAMGWLEDLAAEQDTPLEDLPTIAGVVDEALFVEPPAAVEPEPEAPTDELTEALDWLEQLALQDSDSIPRETVKMPIEETAVSGSEDDLAAALDWLDQLAQPEKTPEKPAAGLVDLADLSDDMPDDPDEALAWLQQVAAEQEEIDVTELASTDEDEFAVDLFEVPEAAETVEPEAEMAVEPAAALDDEPTETETEDDILAEMPDDPEAMMAWLERLAARQGAKLEELPSVSADDMPVLADEPAPEIEEPVDMAELLTDVFPDEIDELPEDEDDAALLDDLMDIGAETAVTTADDDSPGLVELEDVAVSEADLTELEVPEDMDDAMAWLEALAAQQGARLEELPTLSSTGELSPEFLDEVDDIAETAVAPDSLEILTDVEEVAVMDEASPDFSGADETSFIPDDEPAEDGYYLSEGIEEALPEWLDVDTDSLEEMPGQTQWLRDLDEPDIEGWLDEEETTISDLYDDSVLSRSEPLSDSLFETGPLTDTAVSDTDLFDMPEDEIETTVFSLDDEKLAAARQAVDRGTFNEALHAYQTLVDAGGGMMSLIADLETVAVDHPEQPLFRHLLGDAYMRNGQLQKALDTYRVALDQI